MRKAIARRPSPRSSSAARIPQPAPFRLLPNLGLRPEVGKTKEIGINIRQDGLFVANDALRIKANVFRNDVTDFIEQTSRRQRPGGGRAASVCTDRRSFGCIQYQNIPSARIRGAEFEGNYDAGTGSSASRRARRRART